MRETGIVKRAVVTPDKHFPVADMKAISVLCQAIEIVKPDIYIDLGDTGEWEGASHWKWKRKKKPPIEFIIPEIETDIIDVNSGMDIIDESLDKVNCKEKHFIEGNHEEWVNMFVTANPYLDCYKIPTALKLKSRGYEYHRVGKALKIGKLYFYHGHHYAGVNHTRNHLLKLGVNIMYGHHHDIQQYSLTRMDDTISAWSIGCLKDMSPEKNSWLGNRKVNWSHAFAVIDFLEDGNFIVHVVSIINGKTTLFGDVIYGY